MKEKSATQNTGACHNSDGLVWLNLDESTGFHLNTLSNRFALVQQSYYRPYHKLNTAGWRVIATLAEKAPMSAKEVAEYTVMDPIRISRSVSDLLKRRLISRLTDPQDRRKILLSLTKKGMEVYHDVTPFIARKEEELYGILSPSERKQFLQLVLKLEDRSQQVFGKIPSAKDVT